MSTIPHEQLGSSLAPPDQHLWQGPEQGQWLSRKFGRHEIRVRPYGQHDSGKLNAFLVHGMADSAETWRALLPTLHTHNIWLFDLPWSGRDGADWPSQMSAQAWWRAAFDLAAVTPSLCIGHSFGATLLLDWALRRDATLAPSHLVLISPIYRRPGMNVSWDDLDRYARAIKPRFKRALLARFGDQAPATPILSAMAEKLTQRVLPDAMVELFRVFLASSTWDLPTAGFEVDLVFGEYDGEAILGSVQALSDLLPVCRSHRLADCGHYSMHEQPGALAGLLKNAIQPSWRH